MTETDTTWTTESAPMMHADAIHADGCCDSALGASLRQSRHADPIKASLITRLNRIEGQTRGIKGMIERDAYCDDVLNQIAAIQSALNGVSKLLLESHMKTCMAGRMMEGDREAVDELLKTIHKLIKS